MTLLAFVLASVVAILSGCAGVEIGRGDLLSIPPNVERSEFPGGKQPPVLASKWEATRGKVTTVSRDTTSRVSFSSGLLRNETGESTNAPPWQRNALPWGYQPESTTLDHREVVRRMLVRHPFSSWYEREKFGETINYRGEKDWGLENGRGRDWSLNIWGKAYHRQPHSPRVNNDTWGLGFRLHSENLPFVGEGWLEANAVKNSWRCPTGTLGFGKEWPVLSVNKATLSLGGSVSFVAYKYPESKPVNENEHSGCEKILYVLAFFPGGSIRWGNEKNAASVSFFFIPRDPSRPFNNPAAAGGYLNDPKSPALSGQHPGTFLLYRWEW